MNPDLNPCSPGLYNAPTPWESNLSPSRGIGSSTNILSPNHNSPLRATVSSSSAPAPPPTAYPTKESRRQPPPPQILLVPPSPPYRSITALATATALPTTPPITGNVSPIGMNPLPNRVPSAPTSPARARSMGDMCSAQPKAHMKLLDTEPELSKSKSIVDLTRSSGKSSESIKSSGTSSQPQEVEPVMPGSGITMKKETKQRYAFTRRCKLEPHFNTKFPVLVHWLHLG